MLPYDLLEKMLGTEFFRRIANNAVSRGAKPLPHRRPRTPVALGIDTGD
jgi:hypothetical protein